MKSKKLKGIIATIGVATVVMGSLAGCGNKAQEVQQDNKQSQIETKIENEKLGEANNKNQNVEKNNEINSRKDVKDLFTKIDDVRSGKDNNSINNKNNSNKINKTSSNDNEAKNKSKDKVERVTAKKDTNKNNNYVAEKVVSVKTNNKKSENVVHNGNKTINNVKETGKTHANKSTEKPAIKHDKPVEKPHKEENKVIKTMYVTADVLNVRAGAGTDFDKIGELTRGTKVEVVKSGESWNKIKFDGKYGYVFNKYLANSKPANKPVEKPDVKPSKPTENHNKPVKPVEKPYEEQKGLAGQISKTKIAQKTNQIILVSGNNLSLWNKSNGKWHESLSTSARLGYGGLTSNKHEGDGATPTGAYPILYGFGFGSNPGTSLEYKRITNNSYFVDDVHSSHYNTWYEGKGQKGEHMIDHPQYKYGMVIGYNTSHTKGKGSAIFLHCNGRGNTAGCVSVPQSTMLRLLKSTHEGAYIIITSSNNNLKYY